MKPNQLPELSAETIIGRLLYLLKLPNNDFMVRAKKKCGLLLLGIRKEVVEELCKEPEGDREAAIKAVRARVERERRELDREHRLRNGS
jgi:hypothetical protein